MIRLELADWPPLSPFAFLSVLNAMWLAANVWSLVGSETADHVSVWARRRAWSGVIVAAGVELFAVYPLWRETPRPVFVAGFIGLITTCIVGTTAWILAQWQVMHTVAPTRILLTTCVDTSDSDCTP